MRLLLFLAVMLTTACSQVSAQSSHQNTRHTTVYVDMSEPVYQTPQRVLTANRLWAPCQHGVYQWWREIETHYGPGWDVFAGHYRWFDNRVVKTWVAENQLRTQVQTKEQPEAVIHHRTINVWQLRDNALREMESSKQNDTSTKTKVLHEPVYRVPKSKEETNNPPNSESINNPLKEDGWRPTPKSRKRDKPKAKPSYPSGPVMYANNTAK